MQIFCRRRSDICRSETSGSEKNFVFGDVKVKSDKGELLAEISVIFVVPKRETG